MEKLFAGFMLGAIAVLAIAGLVDILMWERETKKKR